MLQFLRHHMDSHLDDNELQTLLKKTQVRSLGLPWWLIVVGLQVLAGKDFKAWDFGLCLQLLEGPLTNAPALSAALKTKFIKRLLSFLKPSKKLFSDVDWSPANMKYAKVALKLIKVRVLRSMLSFKAHHLHCR